jgi:hypothetical protein
MPSVQKLGNLNIVQVSAVHIWLPSSQGGQRCDPEGGAWESGIV